MARLLIYTYKKRKIIFLNISTQHYIFRENVSYEQFDRYLYVIVNKFQTLKRSFFNSSIRDFRFEKTEVHFITFASEVGKINKPLLHINL